MHPSLKYLRREVLPTPFCSGCGCGIVINCFLKAVEELGYEDLSEFVFCSGIGCAAWIPSPHFKADSVHVTHGRAIPVALGIKLCRPELHVVVFGGDGDVAGIGGNHLIHAARRNADLLVIMVNNMIYGMTGGQVAPTTPKGAITTTTPYGNVEYPIDAAKLVEAAGANYVARWTTFHVHALKESIKKAIGKKGFRFIEVLSQCPTNYGRRVGLRRPVDMLKWFKENTTPVQHPEEGKITVGEFADRDRESLLDAYRKLLEKAKAGKP